MTESNSDGVGSSGERFPVEVAYATPERQLIITLVVADGTTAMAAARQSGIEDEFRGLTLDPDSLGIFGRPCPPDQVLVAGDRVEIYRPLIADPKELRRRRARSDR